MSKPAFIVTGLGYGDEGKGVTTKWLSLNHKNNPLVIRYGGGNQIGHTVMVGNLLHEHHHTGSASTSNIDTFYSRFCTVDPIGTFDEIEKLKTAGFRFMTYYDPRAMLVTPLDVDKNIMNHQETKSNQTVGVGFGTTIQRNEDHHRLYVRDILHEETFKTKCEAVARYYRQSWETIDEYYQDCLDFISVVKIVDLSSIHKNYDALIFEGHQGVLLDMEYGIFPHVTRSKTTGKNAYTILNEEDLLISSITNFMVTRCYHTRHGDGVFKETSLELVNNEWETNKPNHYQGEFKIGELDLPLLRTAIKANQTDTNTIINGKRILNTNVIVVTCMDQLKGSEDVFEKIKHITADLNIREYFTNSSPKSRLKEG